MKLIDRVLDLGWRYFALFAFVVILFFSLIFYGLSIYAPADGLSNINTSALGTLYYSFSTFSNLNYHNISAQGISKYLSSLEGLLGIMLFGIIIAKLVSIRQEALITRMYYLDYIEHFRRIRHELGKSRVELKNTTIDFFHEPNNPKYQKKVTDLFHAKPNVFRKINTVLSGLSGFLKHESERKEYILKELDIYHIEFLFNSVFVTLKEIFSTLERFKIVKYNEWKTGHSRGDLKYILKHANHILDFIKENYESSTIDKSYLDAKKVSERIKNY